MVPKKAGYWWLHILFFASGFPALLYQIIWQRALFAIYGVNIESVTVVVSAFMLGLGLGSLVGGWLSRRDAPLLVIFALIELSIASFGVISLRLFHWAASFTDRDRMDEILAYADTLQSQVYDPTKMETAESIRRRTRDKRIITDDNMASEWTR